MKKESKRQNSAQIDNNLIEWDLSDLYQSIEDPNITKDFAKLSNLTEDFYQRYYQKIATNTNYNDLESAILDYQIIAEGFAKISCFAYLNYAKNLNNSSMLSFFQNNSEKISEQESRLVFFSLEINQISEDNLQQQIDSSAVLKKFKEFITDIRNYRKYQLSEEVEKILIEKSNVAGSAWIRLFDETVNGLEFDLSGKKLDVHKIFNLLSSNNSNIRKKAAESISKTFAKNIKTFCYITNVLAKDKSIDDKYRGFATVISSRNIANNIEDSVVAAMIKQVKENYHNISHRYYKIKAKILGLEKLNYWDRNAPLQNKREKLTSFDEARSLVLQSYADFHPEMANIANQFFEKSWIDAKPIAGKDSGAFSHPAVPSAHPYILMNYQGKTRDVATLAHELGHGIHQFMAKDKGFLLSQTPLTLAETASVFGEQLVFQKMLKQQKSQSQRIFTIAHKVEDMINTTIRQIAFLEFELRVHNARKNSELSCEQICNIWLEVQKESLGDAFDFSADYRFFWCYIPHFIHSPFYVYSYAFGDCLVNSLYSIYQSGKIKNFEEKYLELLQKGGSEKYNLALEPFGLDLSSPEFWQGGLNFIAQYVDEIEKHFN